jgi:hypothetical protein
MLRLCAAAAPPPPPGDVSYAQGFASDVSPPSGRLGWRCSIADAAAWRPRPASACTLVLVTDPLHFQGCSLRNAAPPLRRTPPLSPQWDLFGTQFEAAFTRFPVMLGTGCAWWLGGDLTTREGDRGAIRAPPAGRVLLVAATGQPAGGAAPGPTRPAPASRIPMGTRRTCRRTSAPAPPPAAAATTRPTGSARATPSTPLTTRVRRGPHRGGRAGRCRPTGPRGTLYPFWGGIASEPPLLLRPRRRWRRPAPDPPTPPGGECNVPFTYRFVTPASYPRLDPRTSYYSFDVRAAPPQGRARGRERLGAPRGSSTCSPRRRGRGRRPREHAASHLLQAAE